MARALAAAMLAHDRSIYSIEYDSVVLFTEAPGHLSVLRTLSGGSDELNRMYERGLDAPTRDEDRALTVSQWTTFDGTVGSIADFRSSYGLIRQRNMAEESYLKPTMFLGRDLSEHGTELLGEVLLRAPDLRFVGPGEIPGTWRIEGTQDVFGYVSRLVVDVDARHGFAPRRVANHPVIQIGPMSIERTTAFELVDGVWVPIAGERSGFYVDPATVTAERAELTGKLLKERGWPDDKIPDPRNPDELAVHEEVIRAVYGSDGIPMTVMQCAPQTMTGVRVRSVNRAIAPSEFMPRFPDGMKWNNAYLATKNDGLPMFDPDDVERPPTPNPVRAAPVDASDNDRWPVEFNGSIVQARSRDAIDAPPLPGGTRVSRSILIGNISDAPITLTVTGLSCGCLAPTIPKAMIAPREATVVELAAVVPPVAGRYRHTATVTATTSDGRLENVPLQIGLASDAEFVVVPDVLAITSVAGEPIEQRVYFQRLGPGALEFTPTQVTIEGLHAEGVRLAPENKGVHVGVVAGPAPEAGARYGFVEFSTSSETKPSVSVPIRVRTLERWRAEPNAVIMYDGDGATTVDVKLVRRGVHAPAPAMVRGEAGVQFEGNTHPPPDRVSDDEYRAKLALASTASSEAGRVTNVMVLSSEGVVLATIPIIHLPALVRDQ